MNHLSIAAVPAVLFLMQATVESAATVSAAVNDTFDGAIVRMRRSVLGVAGIIGLFAVVTGNTDTMLTTAITLGLAYLYIEHILIANP